MYKSKHKATSQNSGFRVSYIEIYNWGTFDESIWRLNPNGKNSLLTGANGSGKTTLVDAIITLLVPSNKRHYNQSSGAESKRERSEKTYVQGAYVTVQSDSGLSAKTKYLRTKDDFSILLGVFFNGATKEYVTLAQVRWFSNNDLKRVYLIAPTALTIEEHFRPLDTGGIWKRKLKKKQKAEEFDSFSKYAQRFSKLFGLKSEKALNLFSQTVGIKVLGNLNAFIRTNMLEESDTETDFLKLKEHYDSLLTAHKAIEKAREQLNLLKPIVEDGKVYHEISQNLEHLQYLEQSVPPYFSALKMNLYDTSKKHLQADIQKKGHQVAAIKQVLLDLDNKRTDLQVAISTDKVYEQLQNIDKQVQQGEKERNQRQAKAKGYNKIAKVVKLKEDPNEKTFYKNLENSRKEINVLQEESQALQEAEVIHQIQLKEQRDAFNQLKEQLLSLQQRKNRIPLEQIRIREAMMNKLNLTESDLPFAAELLNIPESEKEWENVLEHLLRPFGLSLLVKDSHYQNVTKYIQSNSLKGKITFQKVGTISKTANKIKINRTSAIRKIQIKQNSEFTKWLTDFLNQYFDYNCVAGVADLTRSDRAITKKGIIKNFDQHQRDTHPKRWGKADHILGWDNKETVLLTQRKMKDLEEEITKLNRMIAASKKQRSNFQKQRDNFTRLCSYEQFSEIDWKRSAKMIQNFKNEKIKLLQSSNQLKELETQLNVVKSEIVKKEGEKDKLIEQRATLQSRVQNYTTEIGNAKELLTSYKGVAYKNYKSLIVKYFGDLKPSISTIGRLESRVTRAVANERNQKGKEQGRSERSLTLKMQKFINPKPEILEKYPNWTADTVNFGTDIGYLKEYEDLYNKIGKEDLPKHQKRFKDWLNERLIFDIANFKTALENKEVQILESIEQINDSLRAINFNNNPTTYIILDINKSRDNAIREFKQMLRDAMPDPAKLIKGDEEALEASFRRIKKIIEELSANEAWRKKVTDVRNWLEFAAIERYKADDAQRQYYVDSQSLSGGEKAKLAYTILASAIAYQFGIRTEGKRKKSFRFAVVDEAFSKVDPENAVYAMELFKQLNLQLMVVTPLDKINLAEPYIHAVHYVENREKKNSAVYDLSMQVYEDKKKLFREKEEN